MGRYTLILLCVWGLFGAIQSIEPEPRAYFSGVLALAIAIYAARTLRRPREVVSGGQTA